MPEINQLIEHLDNSFVMIGVGPESPFWTLEFSLDSIFWSIPRTKYFVIYDQHINEISFFKIAHNERDVPAEAVEVIWDDSSKSLSADEFWDYQIFYCKMPMYDIIHRFGKKYNFLLYNIDLLQ